MMTLDLGHGELLCEENRSLGFVESSLRELGTFIYTTTAGEVPHGYLHLPPGEGLIDLKGLFEALHGIHYARTVTLELKPHEIRKCLAYVSELVSGLPMVSLLVDITIMVHSLWISFCLRFCLCAERVKNRLCSPGRTPVRSGA